MVCSEVSAAEGGAGWGSRRVQQRGWQGSAGQACPPTWARVVDSEHLQCCHCCAQPAQEGLRRQQAVNCGGVCIAQGHHTVDQRLGLRFQPACETSMLRISWQSGTGGVVLHRQPQVPRSKVQNGGQARCKADEIAQIEARRSKGAAARKQFQCAPTRPLNVGTGVQLRKQLSSPDQRAAVWHQAGSGSARLAS